MRRRTGRTRRYAALSCVLAGMACERGMRASLGLARRLAPNEYEMAFALAWMEQQLAAQPPADYAPEEAEA